MKIQTKDKLIITGLLILPAVTIALVVIAYKIFSVTINIILFSIIFIAALVHERLGKKKNNQAKMEFLPIGQKLFGGYRDEFTDFYNLFLQSARKFLAHHALLINDEANFDSKSLTPVEVIYLFAHSKKIVQVVDWRGEENEGEIETFIERLLNKKIHLPNTIQLRNNFDSEGQRNYCSIINLFKAIDKDLYPYSKQLIFFDLGWDAYAYTVIDLKTFAAIKKTPHAGFYGTNKWP